MDHILTALTETATDLSANYGLNLFNADDSYKALTESSARASMIDTLLAESDFSEVEAAQFRMIAENSAEEFIAEASTSQDIKPFAPFQMSLLKEFYARRIGRKLLSVEAMPTTTEKFGIFETKIEDAAGNIFKLNEIDQATNLDEGWKTKPLVAGTLFDGLDNANLTAEEQAVANKMIDISSKITSIKVGGVVYPADVQPTEDGAFNQVVEFDVAGVPTFARVYGRIDYKTGEIVFHSAVAGQVTDAEFTYRLSNNHMEINDLNLYIEYNPDYRVSIGDGRLINVGLPMNWLKDLAAFTSMDGLATAVKRLGESLVVLDDVDILRTANTAANASGNVEVFTKYVAAGANVSVVDYNRGLLHSINSTIAAIDSRHQYTSISEFNVAANPIDANTLFSPTVLLDNKPNDNSLVSGNYGYKTTALVSGSGTVNILSTKHQNVDNMVIVPKSQSKDERIFSQYVYSSVLLTDNSYRNKKSPLIKNLVTKERNTIVVHEAGIFGKVNLV